jgi:hypothetical protein
MLSAEDEIMVLEEDIVSFHATHSSPHLNTMRFKGILKKLLFVHSLTVGVPTVLWIHLFYMINSL